MVIAARIFFMADDYSSSQSPVASRQSPTEDWQLATALCYFHCGNPMNESGSALAIHTNVSLSPYTTLGVGGPARFFVRAETEDHVRDAMDFALSEKCPVFILGGGSNIVVSDSGFRGLVIKIEIPGIQPLDGIKSSRFSAGAGVEWDVFVQHCVAQNLAGIECLSGIPGTVGGTPVQNVGAYGEEVGEVISGVRAVDRNSNEIKNLSPDDCGFGYRSSTFNTTQKDRYVILRVDFELRPDGCPCTDYEDLQRYLGSHGRNATLAEVREAVIKIRKTKAMVLESGNPDAKSVGSFFRNPVMNPAEAAVVEERARERGFLGSSESLPRLEMPEGRKKLPAAWLVEHAGFRKGYEKGRAGLSSRHALAIINRGGASAQDILDLMQRIQAEVRKSFGVDLKPEPIFVGF
jgi:UDP-N-acetylmuramate dehydrogenase